MIMIMIMIMIIIIIMITMIVAMMIIMVSCCHTSRLRSLAEGICMGYTQQCRNAYLLLVQGHIMCLVAVQAPAKKHKPFSAIYYTISLLYSGLLSIPLFHGTKRCLKEHAESV